MNIVQRPFGSQNLTAAMCTCPVISFRACPVALSVKDFLRKKKDDNDCNATNKYI
jgi:hypothetical protein